MKLRRIYGILATIVTLAAASLISPQPAPAFTPEQEGIYKSCLNTVGDEFKLVKRYVVGIWGDLGSDDMRLYCGLEEKSDQSHGYYHIKTRHALVALDGDWADEFDRLNDFAPDDSLRNWQDLMDVALTWVSATSVVIPADHVRGGSRCWDLSLVRVQGSTGATMGFPVRVYAQDAGGYFDKRAITTAFPADYTCNQSPTARQSAPSTEIGPAADAPVRLISTCDSLGCRWTSGSHMVASSRNGAYYIGGPIRTNWNTWRTRIGYPKQPITCGLVRSGCFARFANSDGDSLIHYSPDTGAHMTRGGIGSKWSSLGSENGKLGYPTNDETCGLVRSGCFNEFQGGSIHWSPNTGAQHTGGAIRSSWRYHGWESGRLGYPTTSERCGLAQGGCYNHFEGDTGKNLPASIYWSPDTGAHAVEGAIRRHWASEGWETGTLGYPIGAEGPANNNGRLQRFQNAAVYWSSATGAMTVYDAYRIEELANS